MSISYIKEKIKSGEVLVRPYFGLIFVVIVGFLSLGLLQLKVQASVQKPLTIVNMPIGEGQPTAEPQNVIASKTGTKYYFPWCGALSRIKPENRVEFVSPTLARRAGYLPAGNCKGVK